MGDDPEYASPNHNSFPWDRGRKSCFRNPKPQSSQNSIRRPSLIIFPGRGEVPVQKTVCRSPHAASRAVPSREMMKETKRNVIPGGVEKIKKQDSQEGGQSNGERAGSPAPGPCKKKVCTTHGASLGRPSVKFPEPGKNATPNNANATPWPP